MKKINKFVVATIAFLISSAAFALPFNSKLSDKDLETLNKGEVLIKSIGKMKNASLDGDSEVVQLVKDAFDNVDANYLAEIIQVRPVREYENLMSEMRAVLENVPEYAGIPYWSVQHERFYDLYETAEILKTETPDEFTTLIDADLYMEPFGMINAPIKLIQKDDFLFYSSGNYNTLEAFGFTAVRKGKLKSVIVLFKDGDNWILYGLGGCHAPKIAIVQKRLETSFLNRIKTFVNFVFTKI